MDNTSKIPQIFRSMTTYEIIMALSVINQDHNHHMGVAELVHVTTAIVVIEAEANRQDGFHNYKTNPPSNNPLSDWSLGLPDDLTVK